MARNITIYTTNTCAFCVMVKKYLDSKGEAYSVVNLDEQPEARATVLEMSGSQTVPVTVIQNEQSEPSVLVGFNPAKLAAALSV